MASSRSGKKVGVARIKGGQGGKRGKTVPVVRFSLQISVAGSDYCSNSYSENTLHIFVDFSVF